MVPGSWYTLDGHSIIVSIHAQPGARLNKGSAAIQGLYGDALKIRVIAPPVDGRANHELIRFLAKTFHVSQCDVCWLSGETSRQKRFRIIGSAIDPASLLDSG